MGHATRGGVDRQHPVGQPRIGLSTGHDDPAVHQCGGRIPKALRQCGHLVKRTAVRRGEDLRPRAPAVIATDQKHGGPVRHRLEIGQRTRQVPEHRRLPGSRIEGLNQIADGGGAAAEDEQPASDDGARRIVDGLGKGSEDGELSRRRVQYEHAIGRGAAGVEASGQEDAGPRGDSHLALDRHGKAVAGERDAQAYDSGG